MEQKAQNKAHNKITIGMTQEPGRSHNWSADVSIGNCKWIQFKIKMLLESFTRDWNSAFKYTWETIKCESIKQRMKSHSSWRDSSTPAFEKALQRVCNSTNSTASIKTDCVSNNLSSFFLSCTSKMMLNRIALNKLIYLLNKKVSTCKKL